MNQYPNEITITNGAFALDGGSISILCNDESGKNVRIHLNWSIKAQMSGEGQLYFNDIAVQKRSFEESYVLDLLKNANYEDKSPKTDETQISAKRIIIGEDIKRIMDGMDEGPIPFLKSIVKQLLFSVRSDKYIKGLNYREKECPKCNGERYIEADEYGSTELCDMCKGTGVVGWYE